MIYETVGKIYLILQVFLMFIAIGYFLAGKLNTGLLYVVIALQAGIMNQINELHHRMKVMKI